VLPSDNIDALKGKAKETIAGRKGEGRVGGGRGERLRGRKKRGGDQ